ncbi:uncharacterized protein LOC113315339 [Papaver somniferum]|uniref:uncharacterized protein LOC113315339 n=1 Tax=Papaver somniferum TaxID=3469 RepID=UPI000E6FB9EE|nr:uncharacterized protein LOC113315339 [Papaver somniferum]
MNDTHLLLGRPWQYDAHVVHNYYENTYTFYKDGKHKILHPSKSSTVVETRSDSKTSALVATIAHLFHNNHTLRSHEDKKPSVEILKKVRPLLLKYGALFPEELPTYLLPLHNLQYHVDLIPGASLPNQAQHRLSPQEHEILMG